MNEHRVTFKRLILEGFGPYRDRTEFNFGEEINCYVASNESGKSTMVAGLVATFFGLMHRQRATTPFTLERLRNWDDPSRCRGEVFFAAGEQYYQVIRDFDTHRVELWLIEEDFTRKKMLVEGTHNPVATKRLKVYEEKMQELLGINSQELFSDTFCVEQPLPEPKNISAELQGLLSGGRGTAFYDALKRLSANLKSLTRLTGPNDRGITARNMGKNGILEHLETEISELEQRIENGRQVADSLEEICEQLLSVEESFDKKKEQLDKKERTRQALSNWQLLQNEYRNAARERDKIKQAEAEVRKLQEKLKKLEDELKRDYPEFEGAASEAGEVLEELVPLVNQLQELDETIGGLKKSLQEDSENFTALNNELSNKFSGWDWLGADPAARLKTIRRNAETCKREWDQFRKNEAELEEINNELKNYFSPFENASKEELDLAGNYHRYLGLLANTEDKAMQALKDAQEKKKRYHEARAAFESKYSELAAMPEDVGKAINGKLSAIKEKKELEESEKQIARKLVAPLWLRIGSMVLLAGLAGVLAGTNNTAFLFLVVLVAALIGYHAGSIIYTLTNTNARRQLARTREELRRCKEKVDTFNNKLGQCAAADEAELGRLLQRLYQYEEEKRRLGEEEKNIAEDELEKLETEWKTAEKEKKQFDRKMSSFFEVFDDLSTAYNQWLSKRERKKRLESDLNLQADETWGCNMETASIAPLSGDTAEHWQEVSCFLQVAADAPPEQNVAGMIKQLDGLNERWWQQQEETAVKLAEIKSSISNLDYKIKSCSSQLKEKQEKRKELSNYKNQLDDKIRDILEKNGNNAAIALERWKKRQQIVKDKDAAELQLKTVLHNNGVEDVASIQSLLYQKEDHVTARLLRWKEHIEQNPGLPGTEEAEDLEQIYNYLETTEREIKQLESDKKTLEQSRSELIRKQASLEGESPLNIAAAEIELAEMKQQRERLEIEADALEIAHKELEEAINDFRHAYKEHLEKQASSYCQAIAGVPERYVEFDKDFNISVRESGRACSVDQLSKGARDQLYLALRFAVADLLAEEIKLPLLFDDSFTSTDAYRRENIRQILQKQAQERQFVIMAHADTFSTWGHPIEPKG